MSKSDREAFIALIAPIGVDINEVVRVISEKALQVAYDPNIIKLTDILTDFRRVSGKYKNEVERYSDYIKAGDKLCADAKRGDILALLGVLKIIKNGPMKRQEEVELRRLNIFRQIKRIEEYDTLNRIYGRNILFLGCFSSKQNRVDYLVDRLRVSDRTSSATKLESQALDIIAIDEGEADDKFGQKVIDCFPKSDFVLDCSTLQSLESSCERFFQIYFGHPFISPTRDEHASYIANAAAYRSLDLSRQVGAAIFGADGQVISLGCNEVPAAGGGTYWTDHQGDSRDFVLGYDSNQRVREDLSRDALARLKKSGWLSADKKDLSLEELTKQVFANVDDAGVDDGPWARSMISDIIEYGRMVHAEMNALTDAARFNRSTQGATLYCTTMPCHMCAKLIIAAGVARVVYVQPYVKSLAPELFKDSIAFETNEQARTVNFCTLKGVTPHGFKRAFSRSEKRKDKDGNAKNWNKLKAKPIFLSSVPYYIHSEKEVLFELIDTPIKEVADAITALPSS